MKKNLSVITLLLTAVFAAVFVAGCDMDNMQGESKNTAMPQSTAENSGSQNEDIIGDGESVIAGFEEGMEVKEADIPEHILEAVKEFGEDMLISGVSYATYVGKQTYRVILSETGMGTSKEIYVTANGDVIPTENLSTPTASISAEAQNSPNGTNAPSPSATEQEGK